MVNSDGLIDWADQKRTQQPWKRYNADNKGLGLALHSMEGRYVEPPPRQGNPGIQSSYMFAITRSGKLVQYYPVTASTWSSGNQKANESLWAIEMEGFAGDALSKAQKRTLTLLVEEWEAHTNTVATRDIEFRTLWEHNEVALWIEPNAGATACPSHRYDQWYLDWAERNTPTPVEVEANLNTYLRSREMLRHLASETTQEGEGRMLRSIEILQAKGILPID